MQILETELLWLTSQKTLFFFFHSVLHRYAYVCVFLCVFVHIRSMALYLHFHTLNLLNFFIRLYEVCAYVLYCMNPCMHQSFRACLSAGWLLNLILLPSCGWLCDLKARSSPSLPLHGNKKGSDYENIPLLLPLTHIWSKTWGFDLSIP